MFFFFLLWHCHSSSKMLVSVARWLVFFAANSTKFFIQTQINSLIEKKKSQIRWWPTFLVKISKYYRSCFSVAYDSVSWNNNLPQVPALLPLFRGHYFAPRQSLGWEGKNAEVHLFPASSQSTFHSGKTPRRLSHHNCRLRLITKKGNNFTRHPVTDY